MRLFMILLMAAILGLSSPSVAQEKKEPSQPSKPMCPMMDKMKEMMGGEGMMMGPEKWWQQGAIAQQLVQLTTTASEILAGGNLNPEAQKQLAGVIKKIGETVPEIASPQGPQKPEELQKQLKEMQGVLDKIKLQPKGG